MAHLRQVRVFDGPWQKAKAEILALGFFERGKLSAFQRSVDFKLGGAISGRLRAGDFKGKWGTELSLFTKGLGYILLVGLGKEKKFTLERLRQASGRTAKAAQKLAQKTLAVEPFGREALSEPVQEISQAIAEGLILGSYRFLDYKTSKDGVTVLKSAWVVNGGDKVGVKTGVTIAEAVCFVRDLASHPSNVVTPTRLAEEALKIAGAHSLPCRVMERDEFVGMGMHAFGSVAKGSDEPPKFIVLEYLGGKEGARPIAFVGKGITFDSGGISIKPSEAMDEMKYDMCGAAAVLGILRAAAELRLPVNLVGVIAATENLPGGHASKPGDIVRAYNKRTIEILNTDAEGRLVLADALAYVTRHHKPAQVIDFATLTGAVIVALGHLATGAMGTDRRLLEALKEAGERTGERVWELPLWDDYCEDVKSKIADVKNIGSPRQAGTIAGAAFLKEFVGKTPWVHLDIAGTAWWDKDRPYVPSGPSGVGVRLAIDFLRQSVKEAS